MNLRFMFGETTACSISGNSHVDEYWAMLQVLREQALITLTLTVLRKSPLTTYFGSLTELTIASGISIEDAAVTFLSPRNNPGASEKGVEL